MQPSPLLTEQSYYTNDNLFHNSVFINVEYYFYRFYVFLKRLSGNYGGNDGQVYQDEYGRVVEQGINTSFFTDNLKSILYFFLIIFLTIIAYVIVRMLEVRKKEKEHLKHEIAEFAHKRKEEEAKRLAKLENNDGRPKNPRWENILKHVYSESPADWKLAIIDADEMLLTLMEDMDFKGEGLGEKLKSADRDKFHSLSTAWEVHTIRNRIAHEGINYELSQREAKRVIALYENIFHEYGYV